MAKITKYSGVFGVYGVYIVIALIDSSQTMYVYIDSCQTMCVYETRPPLPPLLIDTGRTMVSIWSIWVYVGLSSAER